MTTMNKRILHTLCVAALMLTACSSNDTIIEESPNQQPATGEITLTATLAPKGDGSGTRAITTGTDGGKEILNVAWEVGEQIAIRYQTGETTYATTIATVKSVDATTHVATIEATITGAIDGGTVNFVYPASLANDTGDDIDESKLLNQNGNLIGANGISTKFDAATGDGKIHLNGGTTLPTTATVTNDAGTGNVTMTNRVCICKFHFDIVESAGTVGPEREFSPIIIRDGNGHTYTITSDKKDDYGISPRGFQRSDNIYIAMLPVSGKTVSFYNSSVASSGYNNYIYVSGNTTLTAGKFYRNLSIDMVKDAYTATQFKFRDLSAGNITATTGDFIYSSGQTANTITIADGATVTLGGVNISATGSAGIICSGDATINLEGTNCVKGGSLKAGISVPSGKTLTISGDGSLTATGGDFAAGIGGNKETSCGSINITGGTVTAAGGRVAAGIGSAANASCSDISISGSANVMATGGNNGAGIGSGCAIDISNSCGAITISGSAHVTATGGEYAAGIGSGYANKTTNTCSDITIIGSANVTATGGNNGAGIGSGCANLDKNICGNITINGLANVTATGGKFGAGIGSGCGSYDNNIYVSSCGAISIEGGTVSAIINNSRGVGIGSTSYGKFASINITSGITSVTATRNNYDNPPIGKGDYDQGSGSITIDGQTISDAMTKGTEALPTFTNLYVVISTTPYTNSTWTITKK